MTSEKLMKMELEKKRQKEIQIQAIKQREEAALMVFY